MPDYSLGKIYKLVSSNGNLCYIGSTTESLAVRFTKHKCNYKRWKAGKYSFVTSFKVFDENDAIIELLERYPCDSRKELEKAERKYIESNKCVNKTIPGRTEQQYRETNKDVINAKRNKKFVCDCGGNYTYPHRSQHLKTVKHQKFVNEQSESD
jgi:hypothetical protein